MSISLAMRLVAATRSIPFTTLLAGCSTTGANGVAQSRHSAGQVHPSFTDESCSVVLSDERIDQRLSTMFFTEETRGTSTLNRMKATWIHRVHR